MKNLVWFTTNTSMKKTKESLAIMTAAMMTYWKELVRYRREKRRSNKQLPFKKVLELSKNELDLVTQNPNKAQMIRTDESEVIDSTLANRKKYGKRIDNEGSRHKIQFMFYKVTVRHSFFLFVHGQKRHEHLVRHFQTNGVTTRAHGLTNKPCTKPTSLTREDIEKAVKFIEYTADLLPPPLPGRL
ncbi:hypothetical protein HHI36_008205 [Cryptolaemus montrouzieri]|uniref:Uncharacterized protein n=1 Tax=Cryptolaemus montrouzieri TaxID=559131 RepID=A0ABD2MRP5_9CUCU